jgi:hypothetical protein
MNCEFTQAGKFMVCTRPGCKNRVPIFNPSLPATKYYATCFSTAPPRQTLRLGSLVADTFAKLGITESRYLAAKRKLGLAPKCGCNARKRWLDEVGKHFGMGV